MRIAIPIVKDEGLYSEVSGHFGQAEYFMIIDLKLEMDGQEFVQSTDVEALNLEYFVVQKEGGPACRAGVDLLLNNKIDILLVEAIGGNPFNSLKQSGIKIYSGAIGIVKEVLQKYLKDDLEELKEGACGDFISHFYKEE